MFPYLRNIIENAHTVVTRRPKDGKHKNAEFFHWLTATVDYDGDMINVGVMLIEDQNGNLFYNINANIKSSEGLPSESKPGSSELSDVKVLNQIFEDNVEGVNIY